MASRTSIELHTDGCRVVDVEVRSSARTAADASADVRVHAFVPNLARDEQRRRSSDLAAALTALRKEHRLATDACFIIWGLRS